MAEQKSSSFTGRSRSRKTRRSVVLIDRLAKGLITFGGIGTILSVLGVALFLIWVVLPLFLPAATSGLQAFDRGGRDLHGIGLDESQTLGWSLSSSGQLELFRLDNGELLSVEPLFPGPAAPEANASSAGSTDVDPALDLERVESEQPAHIVSSSFGIRSETAAFGLSDGSIRLIEIGFKTEILDRDDLEPGLIAPFDAALEDGSTRVEDVTVAFRKGVLQKTPSDQYRLQELKLKPGVRADVAGSPIQSLSHVSTTDGPMVVFFADDRLQMVYWQTSEDMFSGETTYELQEAIDLPLDVAGTPDYIALDGAGREVYLVSKQGRLQRIDLRDREQPYLAETGNLYPPGSSDEVTFFSALLGGTTFIWGDSQGRVQAGFPIRPEDAVPGFPGLFDGNVDPQAQMTFARTKSLADSSSAAVSMASSSRSRLAYGGFADGELRLFNVTNATEIQRFQLPDEQPVMQIALSPKEDGVLVATPDKIFHADLDPRYPEAGFSAFFRPVWYEGYPEPEHIWQSSSGSDDFEMKLGLMPLIFGTLKATFYSMLFGAPLALLAAIFTSELLPRRARSVLKPGIEFMASLPSVVLGFLAALVFAPYLEKVVPATLGVFVTLPITILLGAFCWQLLPGEKAVRWQNRRFLVMVMLVPVGVWLAGLTGPWIERLFFAGDIRGWLSWDPGSEGGERFAGPIGGWMILGVPLAALTVTLGMGRWMSPRMRRWGAVWDRRQYAIYDLLRFVGGIACTLLLALLFSWLMAAFGFDPRGGYVDTYVQRNALIVGFVMGFAIIPIIYTLSEDALSTVPEHLRSASLGAGATPWQTAVRIVIPTAMSGLFSAVMIGLGRAVGETMIVLMAAGNTPVMDMNMFEGFRTLSANIAVELPEAVKGDTHYRTLFLAALVLFLMTFVVNTVAEVIRLRFRKRAYQL